MVLCSWLLLTLGVMLVNSQKDRHHVVLRSAEENVDSKNDWWQTAVFYQIYPRSFMDANNDGTGDLQGIIQRLPHLKDMGVTATWLSPVFKSPQVDQGYDISNYREIDSLFGNLNDLKQLVDEAHELDIKIILDFVPNHTSDKHNWFIQSVAKDEDYADFYIWRQGTVVNETREPPNNWVSIFKDSAWTWNEERQQYYLHQFADAQPDLNYRNPNVVKAMKDVLRFWLDFGADGFRMDAVPYIFEDEELKDEPLSGISGYKATDYEYLKHIYTKDLDETYDMIYQWRKVIDDFNVDAEYPRIMMTEAYTDTIEDTMKYYGAPNGSTLGAHFTFNFDLITKIKSDFAVDNLIHSINNWLSNIPRQYVSNWVLGNHDNSRVATRLGSQNVDAFNMLAAFLPGIQVTYNGEEIGMEDGHVECADGWDPEAIKDCSTYEQTSRDFERTPFHWDDTVNAGFNKGAKTWLPVSEKYLSNNLQAQNVSGIKSHYNIYKKLSELRKNFKNLSADAVSLIKLSDSVLEIIRTTDKSTFMYLFNNGNSSKEIDIVKPEGSLKVWLSSIDSKLQVGDRLSQKPILNPHECLILELSTHNGFSVKKPVLLLVMVWFSVLLFR